jgi:hypothetical protein
MAKKVETETPDPLVTVEFNGHSFSFPRDQEEWPTLAIIAASRKQYDGVVEHLLGTAQWDTLTKFAAPAYRQFMEFLQLFADTVAAECSES